MDVVIPAAGRGSRRARLTADQPTGLVNVAERHLVGVFETPIDTGVDELAGITCILSGIIRPRKFYHVLSRVMGHGGSGFGHHSRPR